LQGSVIRITARNRVLEIPLFNLEQPSADVTVFGDLCHSFALNDL
jgi:hypothetical protein